MSSYSVIPQNASIALISTNDRTFETNGQRVGDPIMLQRFDAVKTIPGWGSVVRLNSGWYAAWLSTEGEVNNQPLIQWFFQYKFNDNLDNGIEINDDILKKDK